MEKIILVTGSTGFIGTNLCLDLLKDGHTVIGISKECSKNIISHRYKVIKHDVRNPFDTFKCGEIYHLASYASCSYFEKDPVSIADTILLGTINALNFAKAVGAKFLYASTYGVYSDSNNLKFRSCYDSSKLAMESYVYNFGKQNNISTKILRIPSVYGPYMRLNENKLITNFIKSALTNKKLELWGNTSKERPFCFVGDLIKFLKYVMEKDFSNPKDLTQNYIRFWSAKKLSEIIPEMIKTEDYKYGFKETINYFKQEILKQK